MAVFKKIQGIIGTTFKLGIGATAHAIVDNADGVSITANNGTTLANALVARPQGGAQNTHASTYLDLKERVIDLEFSFAGDAAPAPGANTGKYGICHTSGSDGAVGVVYLDGGTALTVVPLYQGSMVSPRSSFNGTIAMNSDNLYMAESGSAPHSWTQKGGEAHEAGEAQCIGVSFSYTDIGTPVDSAASIPDGAVIIRTAVLVSTQFAGGAAPTILVAVHGTADTTLSATTDNNASGVSGSQYDVEDLITLDATDGGPVRVTLGGTATSGVGMALVHYVIPAV